MAKKLHLFLLILFSLFLSEKATAVHMMGGEITWQCIGQDSFLVQLAVYRDCNAVSVSAYPLVIKCASTGTTIASITMNPGSPVDVTPVCNSICTRCQSSSCSFPYGIHKYTMQTLVTLNTAGSCCSIKMYWEQCCRNASITTGAGGSNFWTEATLNRCLSPCDNSPSFSTNVVPILCVGQDFTFNHGVQDVDAGPNGGLLDSLTYEWAEPLGNSGAAIPYTGQYSYNKAIYFWGFPNDNLPFPRGIHLDPESGDILFRPMKTEVTVMAVKVNEFRNGVKIAEIRRDMQIIVVTCTNNNPPLITVNPNNTTSKTVCAGDPVLFDFTTSDPNTIDTLTINWNQTITGAQWSSTNGQVRCPSATFSWNTAPGDESVLPYQFSVSVTDSVCPVPARYIRAFTIYVNPRIPKDFSVTKSNLGCGKIRFTINNSFPGQTYTWYGNNFALSKKQGNTLDYVFSSPGTYYYHIVTYYKACTDTFYDSVVIPPFLKARLPNDTTIYSCDTLLIRPTIVDPSGIPSYHWNSGDTTENLLIRNLTTDKTVILNVADSFCAVIDTMLIRRLNFQITLPNDTSFCLGTQTHITPTSIPTKKAFTYLWSTGDTTYSINTQPILTDTAFKVQISDSHYCFAEDTIKIKVDKINVQLPSVLWACVNSTVNLSPVYECEHMITKYLWSTGDATPTIKVNLSSTNTTIIVTVYDFWGNSATDTIDIYVDNIRAILPNDTAMCYGDNLKITGLFQNNLGYVSYLWSNGATSSNISVSPSSSQNYWLKVTDHTPYNLTCESTDYIYVKVNPLPTATIIYSGQPIFCPGDSFLLSANAGNNLSYLWYKDFTSTGKTGIIYTALSPGNYYVNVTDSYGCQKNSSVTTLTNYSIDYDILFIAAPRIITSPPFNVAFDNLTPDAHQYNFTWYFGDGSFTTDQDPIHTYNDSGIYSVLLEAKNITNGCRNFLEKSDYIHCSGHVSISDPEQTQELMIFPNPAQDELTIVLPSEPEKSTSLEIFNTTGQLLIQQKLTAASTLIDISSFTEGVYIVKVFYPEKSIIKQLVKN